MDLFTETEPSVEFADETYCGSVQRSQLFTGFATGDWEEKKEGPNVEKLTTYWKKDDL